MIATEYRSYLAANILGEDRVITYRTLSRALRVHVNVAKQMLYEFHQQENHKKPGSVFAIYLIAGTKPKLAGANGLVTGDRAGELIRHSPNLETEEVLERSPIICVTLAGEADLQELRSRYEAITSTHVYSLASHPLKDLRTLSATKEKSLELHAGLHTEIGCSVYGTVTNKCTRRRNGIRSSPSAAIAHAQTLDHKISPHDGQDENVSTLGKMSVNSRIEARSFYNSDVIISKSSQEKNKKIPNSPQIHSTDIFKSFAKAKPKLKHENTDVSAGASGLELARSGADDELMKNMSEDEEDSYVPPVRNSTGIVGETYRESQEERTAALKRMMDEDDVTSKSISASSNVESNEPLEETCPTTNVEEATQVSGGRRRGRRRILTRKQIKDEDGYLVTREEPTWESFSEDETVVTRPKPSSSETVKKGSGRAGQGSIMSFFGKK